MFHLFIKISKIILLGLLPLLLISSAANKRSTAPAYLNGTYLLKATGDANYSLKGDVTFEASTETTSKGLTFSTLKLNFGNGVGLVSHTMEFLISKENESDILKVGVYNVNAIEGFLNQFNGVFGVVNIDELGEMPFFAIEGAVKITELDKSHVKGRLNIVLSNEKGQKITILGNFEAR